jgi:hypothetical protein
MTTSDYPIGNVPAGEVKCVADELHHLKELLHKDSVFAEELCSTETTEEATRLAGDHGILVTPEALWRNRGMLVSGGRPTWRG